MKKNACAGIGDLIQKFGVNMWCKGNHDGVYFLVSEFEVMREQNQGYLCVVSVLCFHCVLLGLLVGCPLCQNFVQIVGIIVVMSTISQFDQFDYQIQFGNQCFFDWLIAIVFRLLLIFGFFLTLKGIIVLVMNQCRMVRNIMLMIGTIIINTIYQGKSNEGDSRFLLGFFFDFGCWGVVEEFGFVTLCALGDLFGWLWFLGVLGWLWIVVLC